MASLDRWVPTLVHCLVEIERRAENQTEQHANTYKIIVRTTIKQVFGNCMVFLMHRPWKKVRVEEDRLGSLERKDAVMRMMKTATSVQALRLVTKALMSENEKWCRAYLMDARAFLNDGYVVQALDDVHIELLGTTTDRYEAFEEVKQERVVVGISERKTNVSSCFNACCAEIGMQEIKNSCGFFAHSLLLHVLEIVLVAISWYIHVQEIS